MMAHRFIEYRRTDDLPVKVKEYVLYGDAKDVEFQNATRKPVPSEGGTINYRLEPSIKAVPGKYVHGYVVIDQPEKDSEYYKPGSERKLHIVHHEDVDGAVLGKWLCSVDGHDDHRIHNVYSRYDWCHYRNWGANCGDLDETEDDEEDSEYDEEGEEEEEDDDEGEEEEGEGESEEENEKQTGWKDMKKAAVKRYQEMKKLKELSDAEDESETPIISPWEEVKKKYKENKEKLRNDSRYEDFDSDGLDEFLDKDVQRGDQNVYFRAISRTKVQLNLNDPAWKELGRFKLDPKQCIEDEDGWHYGLKIVDPKSGAFAFTFGDALMNVLRERSGVKMSTHALRELQIRLPSYDDSHHTGERLDWCEGFNVPMSRFMLENNNEV